MKKKLPLIILVILAIIICCLYFTKPETTTITKDKPINLAQNPIQNKLDQTTNIPFIEGDLNVMIKAQRKYKISALVLGTKNYYSGWNSQLAPVDLALGWGKMTDKNNLKYIKIWQSRRFYFYKYKADSPLRKNYIKSHSCNNHIIPATKNLEKALKSISKGDRIELEGFLVNIKGSFKNGKVWWNTSLTREDSGNGACEVIYAKKIRIGDKVYE